MRADLVTAQPSDWLIAAVSPPWIAQPEIGENSLACDRGLAFRNQRIRAFGQENVQPRAETDQTKTLARADRLAFPNEGDNTPRHEPRDLDHADAPICG